MPNSRTILTRRLLAKALHPLFITALLVVALGRAPAQPSRAELARPAGAVSPQGLLNPDGTLDLSTGFEGTLDLSGWGVTLDGKHGPVLQPASNAAVAGTGWEALPKQGLDARVFALAVMGGDLYVAGLFSQTGDGSLLNLGCIARYDTAAGTWHALNNQGLDNTIFALTVVGSDLYVGGLFTQTGDGSVLNLGRIARYDTTAGTWHALNSQGLNDTVHTLAVSGSDLYVGGEFTQTGDGALTDLGRIARYDTTAAGSWHALSNQGLSSWVEALLVVGSDLYVGGLFNQTGDFTLALGRIARYDTADDTWHALSKQGLNNYVFVLMLVDNDLYVGGSFTQTDDGSLTDLGRIARYNTLAGAWQTLPNQGLNAAVRALALVGSDLYVGGSFTQTGDGSLTDLGRVARSGPPPTVYLPLVLK